MFTILLWTGANAYCSLIYKFQPLVVQIILEHVMEQIIYEFHVIKKTRGGTW